MVRCRECAYATNFNSRPYARGDETPLRSLWVRTPISIHAPTRGATYPHIERPFVPPVFQFTPLREGRRGQVPGVRICHQFQFTPLREGRRNFKIAEYMHFCISIHAPTRGATCWTTRQMSLPTGFQFTPLREGRHRFHRALPHRQDFNSRPYARGDEEAAPEGQEEGVFQFTPLREGRLKRRYINITAEYLFQFTPLREGRRTLED